MKITEVRVETFRYTSDKAKDIQGHAHPTDPHDARQSLLTIETDEGLCGYSFWEEVAMAQGLARPLLPGETPSTANASGKSAARRRRRAVSGRAPNGCCATPPTFQGSGRRMSAA